jgi:hypothetical protein
MSSSKPPPPRTDRMNVLVLSIGSVAALAQKASQMLSGQREGRAGQNQHHPARRHQ